MKICSPHWDRLISAIEERGAIWGNALEIGGLYLMGVDEQGNDYCPICEAVKHGIADADWWINNAADGQLGYARELGLLPPELVQ